MTMKKDDEERKDDERKTTKNTNCNIIFQHFDDKIKKMKELNQKVDFDYKELQSLLRCKSKHNKEKLMKLSATNITH